MVQNDIRFVFPAPLTPDGEIAEHVREHGDGVHDIAFAVDDVESAWRETTTRGAAADLGPGEVEADAAARAGWAVRRCAAARLSFVARRDYGGVLPPGYRAVKSKAAAAGGLSL